MLNFLIALVSSVNGAIFAGLTTRTALKANKAVNGLENAYFGVEIFKISKKSVLLGVSYEMLVNNRRKKLGLLGNFVADSVNWAFQIGRNRSIIAHKTKDTTYLQFAVLSERTIRYEFADGTPLSTEQIQYIKIFTPQFRENYAKQGLPENKSVQWRMVNVKNIMEIRANKHVCTQSEITYP